MTPKEIEKLFNHPAELSAITMTIHLRATKRVKELQATGMTFPMKVDAAPAPDGGTWGSIFGALFGK